MAPAPESAEAGSGCPTGVNKGWVAARPDIFYFGSSLFAVVSSLFVSVVVVSVSWIEVALVFLVKSVCGVGDGSEIVCCLFSQVVRVDGESLFDAVFICSSPVVVPVSVDGICCKCSVVSSFEVVVECEDAICLFFIVVVVDEVEHGCVS